MNIHHELFHTSYGIQCTLYTRRDTLDTVLNFKILEAALWSITHFEACFMGLHTTIHCKLYNTRHTWYGIHHRPPTRYSPLNPTLHNVMSNLCYTTNATVRHVLPLPYQIIQIYVIMSCSSLWYWAVQYCTALFYTIISYTIILDLAIPSHDISCHDMTYCTALGNTLWFHTAPYLLLLVALSQSPGTSPASPWTTTVTGETTVDYSQSL